MTDLELLAAYEHAGAVGYRFAVTWRVGDSESVKTTELDVPRTTIWTFGV